MQGAQSDGLHQVIKGTVELVVMATMITQRSRLQNMQSDGFY